MAAAGSEEEIPGEGVLAKEAQTGLPCIRQLVANAEKAVKSLSGQTVINLYIAAAVLKIKEGWVEMIDLAEETPAGLPCIRQPVTNAVKAVKFLFGPVQINPYSATAVLKAKETETSEDQVEMITVDS